jgi:outer membrane protein TolC
VRRQFRANQAASRAAESNLTSLRQQVAVEVEQAYRTLLRPVPRCRAVAAAQQAAAGQLRRSDRLAPGGSRQYRGRDHRADQPGAGQVNYVQAVYTFYNADAALAQAVGQTDQIGQIGNTAAQNPPMLIPTAPPTPANP